ncbi:MAG: polyprenyl synthetase family protein [candidate division WOR-3 bacterium]
MNIENYLAMKRQLVDKALEKEFGKFDQIPRVLYRAMHYAVFSGGKRLRPILTLMAFEACNGKNPSWVMPFACGIELIHTFSLINDDLPCMDNDDWRRGKPTLHKAFDETTAILAGAALFAKAYELFCQSQAPPIPRLRAIAAISRVIGSNGIVAGQILDIKNPTPSLVLLKRIHRKKTAELIAVSIQIGAIIAGAKEMVTKQLWSAGVDLGMLFQITDDILDAEQDKASQPTFVKRYGLERAKIFARQYARRAQGKFSMLGSCFTKFNLIADWIANRGN